MKGVLFYSLILVLILSACEKDEQKIETEEVFDLRDIGNLKPVPTVFTKLDGKMVSSSLVIKNARIKTGLLPSQTSDNLLKIELHEPSLDLRVASGKTAFLIYKSVQTAIGAEGYYLQIDGTNEYHDVPFDSPFDFEIPIPKSIPTGEFCFSYCIYDSEERVSNTVHQCIQVQEPEGLGSDFLVGKKWDLTKVSFVSTGSNFFEEETKKIGEKITKTYENFPITCENLSQKLVTITEEITYNSFSIELSEDGRIRNEINAKKREWDYNATTCDNTAYSQYDDIRSESGSWSYNQATKTLTLLYDGYYTIKDGYSYVNYPHFTEYRVNETVGELILSSNDTGNNNALDYFEVRFYSK